MTTAPLVDDYMTTLNCKALGTIIGYRRALQTFTTWLADRPGRAGNFEPGQFTRTAVQTYRILVKSVPSGFGRWSVEDQELLRRNPTRGLQTQRLLAPHVLEDDQR